MVFRRFSSSLLILIFGAAFAVAQQPRHLFFRVTAGPEVTAPVSGRLLIFIKTGEGAKSLDVGEFRPAAVFVGAKEIERLAPGESVDVDTDDIAYPGPFSDLKAGDYQAQAVLDVGHTYNYSGRTAGDWESGVVALPNWASGTGAEPMLTLSEKVPERVLRKGTPAQEAAAHLDVMQSAALTKFWGRPTDVKAWVILPPGYDAHAKTRYPTVYWTHGFGGNLEYSKLSGERIYQRMA
ncbi:MAG: enterochelin esterase, partial [Acidobacteriaceae bacterium]